MGRDTNKQLRDLFIYQVYVRNHSEEGTFKAVENDLERIKELGVDIVYLLPIHEIGQKKKKGDLGCPYSIKDYYSVNHEYGTIEDFKSLVNRTHELGMKFMIDIVYNHTSHDSVLLEEHPEYFYKNEEGNFANRVGDWWDITDFDYSKDKGLWEYLINALEYWAKLGVDGFRWDVASVLPIEFLEEAHDRMLEINEDFIFLSESVHEGFTRYLRQQGFGCLSESEIFEVFDIAYDYDTHPFFEGYLKGELPFSRYIDELERQEGMYPENYIKMRNLENHDFGRFAPMVNNDLIKIIQWVSMNFFLKGCNMVYAGQEFCDTNRPSLFDRDLVNWDGEDISPLISTVSRIVKEKPFTHGAYFIHKQDLDVYVGEYKLEDTRYFGVFNVSKSEGEVEIDLDDGVYINLINNTEVAITKKRMTLSNDPVIFKVSK